MDEPRFAFKFTPDRRRVSVISGTEPCARLLPSMDAQVLDDLIHTLIEARTDMYPLRTAGTPEIGSRTISGKGMGWYVEASGNDPGDVMLMVMHPGVGWIALPLSTQAAGELTRQILQELPASPSRHMS